MKILYRIVEQKSLAKSNFLYLLVTEVISNNMYTIIYTCNVSINKNGNTTHYTIIIITKIHKNKLEIHLIQIFYRNELLSDRFFFFKNVIFL